MRIIVTHCQSALRRASSHMASASSRRGKALRMRCLTDISTLQGKGNDMLSCKTPGGTWGVPFWSTIGVVSYGMQRRSMGVLRSPQALRTHVFACRNTGRNGRSEGQVGHGGVQALFLRLLRLRRRCRRPGRTSWSIPGSMEFLCSLDEKRLRSEEGVVRIVALQRLLEVADAIGEFLYLRV